MNYSIRYIILLFALVSCQNNKVIVDSSNDEPLTSIENRIPIISSENLTVEKVQYKYLESLVSDYKFNSEIDYYLYHTKDVGMAAKDYSFVSEHERLKSALTSSDTIVAFSAENRKELEKEYSPVSAKDYIIEESKKHDFLLLNEAHFIPQHRNFLADLLPELSKIGYTNLALEGLNNVIEVQNAVNKNGYPELYHGYYVKDPEFGNMIRKAHKLGFNIFGYDGGAGGDREIKGAHNIIEKIVSFDKRGKTVVLCGYDHIKEGPTGTYWEYALAGRLREFTGKDPLTINQTQYYERAERIYEDSLYQAFDFKEPTVLINASNQSIDLESNPDWYDVFVFHPRTKFIEGIPNWILDDKILQEIELPEMEMAYPCKAMIFEEGDNIDMAVPTYMLELLSKQESIKVPVYKNVNYKILLANKEMTYLLQFKN